MQHCFVRLHLFATCYDGVEEALRVVRLLYTPEEIFLCFWQMVTKVDIQSDQHTRKFLHAWQFQGLEQITPAQCPSQTKTVNTPTTSLQ